METTTLSGTSMRAVQVAAPHEFALVEAPIPPVRPDDVLVKVRAAGICGTDLHILAGEYEARYPLIPGHEFSGDVVAVGEAVTRFKPGDRVTADPNIPCNRCAACQRNEQNQCEDLTVVGVNRPGAFAEYVAVPESVVFDIGDLTYGAGALVEPLACVVWGLQRVSPRPGSTALVQGAGPMGCLMLQALRRAGVAHVTVTDTVQARLELARSLGADTVLPARQLHADAAGYDLVVDVTGIPAVVEASLVHVRPRGTLWLFGVCPPGTAVSVSPFEVFRKDLTIIGSFALSKTFPQSLALIRSGAVNVEPLISHSLPLADFGEALRLAKESPERMKVQVVGAEPYPSPTSRLS